MFMYFIPITVNLTKNSKLEKFVHELNALWKLSGSSMGALRELVAVAGITANKIRLLMNMLYRTHIGQENDKTLNPFSTRMMPLRRPEGEIT
jgi:hypothetical protein